MYNLRLLEAFIHHVVFQRSNALIEISDHLRGHMFDYFDEVKE